MEAWVYPNWPAPNNIKALTTLKSLPLVTRQESGIQIDEAQLSELRKTHALPEAAPHWLLQQHGTTIFNPNQSSEALPQADGFFANTAGDVGVILTADCLPVLFCDKKGAEFAAVHAGWRGLKDGILNKALEKFQASHDDIYVWFGPAIGPKAFEVGEEVLDAFCRENPLYRKSFIEHKPGKWLANLVEMGKTQLSSIPSNHFFQSEDCTYSDPDRYFSYRRSKDKGRMATLIWRET